MFAVACLALGSRARGASFLVTGDGDAADAIPGDRVCATASGDCTLRAAVEEANALPGADVISVPPGKYRLAAGTLAVAEDLTITGGGSHATVLDGLRASRVLSVASMAHVTISGVGIQRGSAESGGGVWNDGTLMLSDVTLRLNRATGVPGGTGYGAAIYNAGGLQLSNVSFTSNVAGGRAGSFGAGMYNMGEVSLANVTFAGNHTNGCGGGIYNFFGDAALSDVSFSRNHARNSGGALFNDGAGSSVLVRVTMDGNHANQIGGGIFNYGDLQLSDVTISGNQSANGGGIFSSYGTVDLTNVTVVLNRAPLGGGLYNSVVGGLGRMTAINTLVANNKTQNCSGSSVVSLGYNLDSGITCGFAAVGDLSNTDPLIGPLRNNGGFNRTRALLTGSPAIDAGDNAACPNVDECGVVRPVDGNGDAVATCDIGAYEAPR